MSDKKKTYQSKFHAGIVFWGGVYVNMTYLAKDYAELGMMLCPATMETASDPITFFEVLRNQLSLVSHQNPYYGQKLDEIGRRLCAEVEAFARQVVVPIADQYNKGLSEQYDAGIISHWDLVSSMAKVLKDPTPSRLTRRSKTMRVYILRGIPGSGKSTLAKSMSGRKGSSFEVFSADDYFTDPTTGSYNFDPSKLKQAHGSCLKHFAEVLVNEIADGDLHHYYNLVVDNTNVDPIDMAPYIAMSEAYNVPVEILTIQCDPETAYQRGIHKVPISTIYRMARTMKETVLPSRWQKFERVIVP